MKFRMKPRARTNKQARFSYRNFKKFETQQEGACSNAPIEAPACAKLLCNTISPISLVSPRHLLEPCWKFIPSQLILAERLWEASTSDNHFSAIALRRRERSSDRPWQILPWSLAIHRNLVLEGTWPFIPNGIKGLGLAS